MKRELVNYIVDAGLVERKDIQRCVLRASMNEEVSVVDEVVDRLDVDQQELASTMAEYWGLDARGDKPFDIAPEVLKVIPEHLAEKYGVLPLSNDETQGFEVAVYDVEKARPVIEKIRDKTGAPPTLVLTARGCITDAISAHYDKGVATAVVEQRESAAGHGVLDKGSKRKRGAEPIPRNSPKGATGSRPESSDEAEPTRQVDVAADNPFMDLAGDAGDGNSVDDEPQPTRAMEGAGPDLLGTGKTQNESESAKSEPTGRSDDEKQTADDSGLAGALEEFDAELEEADDDELDSDPELTEPGSSVNWGEYQTDDDSAFPGLNAGNSTSGFQSEDSGHGSRPDGAAASGARRHEESGVFPVDRGGGDFFDFEDEERDKEEVTLAEVVDRQRHIIRKLEREIEYQKGILQTMAELLVENRVISKRQLKSRLRAFKEEQRKKYE